MPHSTGQLGGVANPAVLLYFPLVAVAGLAFPRPWIVLFAGFACAAHGLLLHYAIPLPAQLAIGLEPRGLTSRMILWAGFCACICITAYVAEAWRRAVADEQKQILQAERQAVRHANVAMATSLAAGAAHELGGPLATIAVASHELVRAIELADSSHDVQADVELISQEVKRARRVLDRLALAEIVDPGTRELVELQDFERELRSALETPQRVTIVAQTQHLLIHRVAVLTMIVSLLRNALSASGPTQLVALKIERQAGSLSFEVCDDGVGISPEILHELGKPFVRGNHQRHGFGLGVFLAKLIAEQLGGTLSYQSEGRGTVARLSLPENLSANATIGPFEDAQSVQGFLR